MAIVLDRTYSLYEMATFNDEFEPSFTTFMYAFTGTVPTWVTTTALPAPYAAYNFPDFIVAPPEGVSGVFTFGVTQYDYINATTLTGTVTITILSLTENPIALPHCINTNLAWFDPIGGWENFIFNGKAQAEQGKGKAATFVNSDGEKRFARRDEVHQGLIVTTGKVSPLSANFIADAFKSVQAYLWSGATFTPIMIDPQTFRRVRSGDSFAEYEFSFIYAVEDIIQTQ